MPLSEFEIQPCACIGGTIGALGSQAAALCIPPLGDNLWPLCPPGIENGEGGTRGEPEGIARQDIFAEMQLDWCAELMNSHQFTQVANLVLFLKNWNRFVNIGRIWTRQIATRS